tara:strand:+ start:533 stop:1564 length:1032 start_codon:yes stop_codon:yes gene_type:complete
MIKKIKNTKIWYFVLRFFIFPIYNFLWKNIINFKARLLYFKWFGKKREFIDLDKNDGILKVNNLVLFNEIAKVVLNACDEKIITKAEEEINNFTENNYNQSNNSTNKYMTEIYDYLSFETKRKIINFASSEIMISTAARYLGVFPILSKIIVDYKIPKNYDNKRGAMLFHKDEYGFKSLDLFMAINDIDKNNGPLKTLKTKFDKIGPFSALHEEKEDLTPGNRGKKKDETIMNNTYVNKDILTIEGKSGTSIFVDSFKYYHAGGHCKTKKRIVMRILYSTIDAISLPNIQEFKKKILFDEYLRQEINNNKFKTFFFLNRSKLFKNKKLSIWLYNFYRKLSFKF